MKKYLVSFLIFMSVGSVTQTMLADTPISFDIEKSSNGVRRAPKKHLSSLEVYLDEVGKTLKFSS